MNDITSFAVTRKWSPRHPDRLQLYSLPTPNGVKISIMLEEIGLRHRDIATFPWVRNLIGFYEAGELVGIGGFPKVTAALERFVARPAVERGLAIPPKG